MRILTSLALLAACSSGRIAAPESSRGAGEPESHGFTLPASRCGPVLAAPGAVVPWIAREERPAPPVVDSAAGRGAYAMLDDWYSGGDRPDVAALVERLAGREAGRAAESIAALLLQSSADARETTAHGRRGRDVDVGVFRRDLADELGIQAAGDVVLPVLRALLADPRVSDEAAVLAILRRTPTKAADAILAEIVGRPERRAFALLVPAIPLAVSRGVGGDAVPRMVQHPHPEVRAAARSASEALGRSPPPFDEVVSLRTWLSGELERVAARVQPPIPPGAPWTRLSSETSAGADVGWLIGQDARHYRLVTWSGVVKDIPRAGTRRSDGAIADEVARLLRMREQGRLGELGEGDSSGFGPIAVQELLVASWLHVRGDDASAARLILPRVAALHAIHQLDDIAADLLSHAIALQIVPLFRVGDDDKVQALAEHLAGPLFAGAREQALAKALIEQVRANAGRPVTIPPAEWEAIRATTSRAEQALFLASRLDHATSDGRHGVTIDALLELRRMRLTPQEAYSLIPWLEDSRFMRISRRWKGTKGIVGTELERTSSAVAIVLDDAVGAELVDAARLAEMSAAERAGELTRIAEFVAAKCR